MSAPIQKSRVGPEFFIFFLKRKLTVNVHSGKPVEGWNCTAHEGHGSARFFDIDGNL